MKKLISIIISICLISALMVSVSACSNSNQVTIAVLQFAEHESLDNCYNGIKAGLKEKGYTDVKFDFQNAKAKAEDNTAYARQLVNKVPDVAVGIATPSAQALCAATQGTSIPVVFTAISDPIGSGFNDYENTTGSSDKLPVEKQIDLIRSFYPADKTIKIGIIYTLTEDNSRSQITEFKALEESKNVQIITQGIGSAEELPTAVNSIIDDVDCFNNLTDNTVVENLDSFLDIASAKNKPIFGSEISQVKKGCVASCSLDYYQLGVQTGYMIAEILDGKDADDIPFLFINEGYTIDYNSTAISTLGLSLPASITGSDVIAK